LTQERPDPLVYRCKKCRRIVASQKNVIPHIPRSVKIALSRKATAWREEKDIVLTKCDITCGQNGQILIEKLKSLACGNMIKSFDSKSGSSSGEITVDVHAEDKPSYEEDRLDQFI
jgi:hypothetical protein